MWKLIQSFWIKHHDSKLLNNLTHGRNAGILGGALSSITLYFTFFYSNIEKTFAGWGNADMIAIILASIFTIIIAGLVDASNADNLPEAFDLILGRRAKTTPSGSKLVNKIKSGWRSTTFSILVFLLSVGCLAFSAVIDWYGRGETAKTIVKEPEKQDEIAVKDSLNQLRKAAIAPYEADIEAIEKEIKKAEREAEKIHTASLAVIKAGEDKWDYHKKLIQKEKNKATKKLKEQLLQLREDKAKVYAQETESINTTLSSIQQDNQLKMNNYLESLSFTEKASGGAGIFFGVMAFVCQLLLSLRNTAEQNVPEYEEQHSKPLSKPVSTSATTVVNLATGLSTDSTTVAPEPGKYPHMQPVKHDNERIVENLLRNVSALSSRVEELQNRPVEVVERVVERIIEKQPENVEKTPKPLSDNGDRKTVVERVVDQSVEIVGVDTKNLRDATMKQWERSFTSKTEQAREENKRKANEGIKKLTELGFLVETNGSKLSIVSK